MSYDLHHDTGSKSHACFLHVSRLLVGSKLQIHLAVPEVVVTIVK